ncbi:MULTISPECIES: hypothetical protein [Rheinheimera]|jgi:hypothetical protein|uniref:Uncharacterized protein n=1 Tax=Rheinheimera tangshanensis TaxID=400153 RepID=A0A5C8LV08_9GAMM|nr:MULTISPECIES: hypothetical protein [Rheinheimera]KOO57926.1 hypothetical protein WH43_12620 [Rheinheimera sp. KL1]TXK79883.1 hypothetical protein FU839_12470 [Rheinheimera tangshanensis]GGM65124.1 hypothetical protein GCM10010920_27370 [Rheinheimera tangshanensis]
MKLLNKAQQVAERLYVWRFGLVFLGLYALSFGVYYLLQGPSVAFEVALLLSVVLLGWVLLAWLALLLFRQLPDWQTPQSFWQKLKQSAHKLWYQLLLWGCLLLSIATLYLMAKALKALLSQLI